MTQGLSTDDIAGRTTPDPQLDQQSPAHPDDSAYPAEAGYAEPPAEATAADAPHAVDPTELPLLDDVEADEFLARWSEVQARFVDDPQGAVRDGDGLVAELMQALARRFSERKGDLEEQWNRGGEPETEELRLALQQYRSFFQRLLAT